MRSSNHPRSALSRALTTFVTFALIVAQTMQPVYAALTALADVPIAAKVAAKPNIFYTLDDSGSMQYNYIPDYVGGAITNVAVTKITRVGAIGTVQVAATAALFVGQYINLMGATQPEYNGQFIIKTIPTGTTFTIAIVGLPVTPATGTITYSVGSAYCRGGNNTAACAVTVQGNNTFTSPPFFTSDFNRMMYNPLVTYTPPLKDTGLPVTIGGVTDANGNMGTTTALYGTVQRDVFLAMFPAGTKDDLRTRVSVPIYCNTDWPVTPGTNLVITDIGTVQGQYAAGTGAYCRINGTAYDASAASGAPAVSDDYNYPYQSSSGANGAQYFYKNLTNKTLYCDTTSPYYPRGAVIGSCNAGVPVAAGAPTIQTCNIKAKTCDPVVGSRVYTTAAPLNCKTDNKALFCAPNVGGSDGNSPGTGALPECQACTCNNTYQPAGGSCRSSGAACTGPYGVAGGDLAECPNIPNGAITSCTGGNPVYNQVTATCTALMFDPNTNLTYVPNTTMLADANTTGVVCRHNNMTYAVMSGAPGGLFSYPRTGQLLDVYAANKTGATTAKGYLLNQKGNFNQAITSGCPTIGQTILIPRHYYTVDSVQFCDNRNNIVDDQWRGFGTGVCSPAAPGPIPGKNDLTQFKNVKYGQFHRRDLYAASATVTTIVVPAYTPATADANGRSWLPGSPTPANSEQVNYANWYAMYATRLNAAKTTTATSFANLTTANPLGDYRVGFQNLGEEMSPYGGSTPLIYVPVGDWTAGQRLTWYNALFGIKVNNFKTPTIDAMIRIGTLVETMAQGGMDAAINPLPGAVDPIPKDANLKSVTCTSNYHVLFTDGATNQAALPAAIGDRDATLPAMPPASAPEVAPDRVVPTLKLGGVWPMPFVQGAPAVPNTLSDVATYYWARDLRPGFPKKDVPSWPGKGICTPSGVAVNCDADWERDVAWWPHVSFSAISFGTEGVLDAGSQTAQSTTMAALAKGLQSWPDLTQPNNPTHPLGNGAGAVAVDDLWHATVNSRGQFVNAKNPTEVAQGLGSILGGIQNQQKSRSGAAFDGQILNATNNVIYKPTVEPGWAGDLFKIQVDTTNGTEVKTWWQASAVLAAQIAPAAIGDEPWLDETKRRVVTLANAAGGGGKTAGPGVPFTYAKLAVAPTGPAILASLASTALQQKKLISYLRGGTTYNIGVPPAGTVTIEGTGIGQFRKRFGAMGDITNAQPVIVSPDTLNYVDATDPKYSTFVATKAARGTFVVAPANDGIVHVIDAGPVRPVAAGGGKELFGFIPKAVFRGTAGNVATEDTTALQSLAYQDGGAPIYHHHFFVDSSPRVADVDFGNGTGNWHTIAVGGLGKGGNSYYALDITDPFTVTDEATAAAKVMWEWTDPDIKYTYGRPVIVKVRETGFPTGRWVVIVTASYNNVSGRGKVFFLDAKTGVLLSTITTAAGNAANPSGLAQTHAFVKNQANQTAEQIYGGDLLGNFWRIDVSTADSYKSAPAVLFAQLTDPSGVVQPVTTAPQIEIDLNNGIDRYVFIGTGRLLDPTDLTTPSPEQQQTMYAIRDGTLTAILTAGLPIQPRVTMQPINADGVSAIAGGAPNGWYHDLPNKAGDSERIVVDVIANVNAAAYIGTQVTQDLCVVDLPAILYVHDYTTGESLLQSGANGPIIASQLLSTGGVGIQLTGFVQADGSQTLGGIITSESGGNSTVFNIKNAVTGPGARMSWRLLTGE
jgi:Tfp pilus tip-associated adhesin PilY1